MSISFKVVREIDNTGRIVIPKDIREAYGIKPKDKLVIKATNKGIYIVKENNSTIE